MYIKKDKSSYFSCNYPIETPDDCYAVFDGRMEQIVLESFPDIDFVIEDDELVNIVPTKDPEPSIDEKVASLQKENQMLTDCILEMSEIVYGGE